ncbi:hypothetical protein K440DRAFT_643650 [Wilcoxina mikolae CBS 423.85]|nr:hypothetical protein K440DRAFT_643650 [Wilcoxina mikolae CBS 423.85]
MQCMWFGSQKLDVEWDPGWREIRRNVKRIKRVTLEPSDVRLVQNVIDKDKNGLTEDNVDEILSIVRKPRAERWRSRTWAQVVATPRPSPLLRQLRTSPFSPNPTPPRTKMLPETPPMTPTPTLSPTTLTPPTTTMLPDSPLTPKPNPQPPPPAQPAQPAQRPKTKSKYFSPPPAVPATPIKSRRNQPSAAQPGSTRNPVIVNRKGDRR